MDIQLIKAACTICQLSGSKEVYFTNIVREFNYPDSLVKEFPDIIDKAIEERKRLIEKSVLEHFKCQGVQHHYVIEQGKPLRQIMKMVSQEKIDLVVLGRKNEKNSGGVLVNRLARRVSCSLMVMPKNATLKLEKVLIPSDFSSYSKMAVEKAVSLAKKSPENTSLFVQNVFQVPTGYHYTGKSFEDFTTIMKDNARKDFQAFTFDINYQNLKVDIIYTLDKDDDVIASIYKKAHEIEANLIIIGAKGRNATTAIFIGSSAEKLIHLDKDIPLLVVRPKGKTAGIVEYLKEL
ncbi:MAG: nucleotide-binding universal stress UspA family protein [Cyclobacteriaceae bacterium]|jgi:nucleotide-binding universal stress UspA family protein